MSPEAKVGVFAIAGLVLVGCLLFIRWLFSGKAGPNPWDEKTEESLHQPDATPLCRRCLEPHELEARYGLPVDSMVPLSPFHQVFALGDILLTGTQRRFPVNWLTVSGYVLLSLIQYLIFAPFYWFFLLRNVRRLRAEAIQKQPREGVADDAQ